MNDERYTTFLDRKFFVNEHVLVPRQKTQWTVKAALKEALSFASANNEVSILDMGTGCGAIGISMYLGVAEKYQDKVVKVEAVDISPQALEVVAVNVKKYNLEDKITVYQSDLLSSVTKIPDILVANLPYLPQVSSSQEQVNTGSEPAIAMFDIKDGLGLGELLLNQINELNEKPKVIVIENDGINIDKLKNQAIKLFDSEYTITKYLDMDEKERGIIIRCN